MTYDTFSQDKKKILYNTQFYQEELDGLCYKRIFLESHFPTLY